MVEPNARVAGKARRTFDADHRWARRALVRIEPNGRGHPNVIGRRPIRFRAQSPRDLSAVDGNLARQLQPVDSCYARSHLAERRLDHVLSDAVHEDAELVEVRGQVAQLEV